MEIIQCSYGGWKIAFAKAPQHPVFQWGMEDCKVRFVEGIRVHSNLKSDDEKIYYKNDDDYDFIVEARLIQILNDDLTPIRLNCCFANKMWQSFYKSDDIYESHVGRSDLCFIKNSHIVSYNSFSPALCLDFEVATSVDNCIIVDGTNTCIKCGFNNPYIDPIPNYTCTQCKMRNEAWA